ncbi:hypothetical protein [Occallatibacter riparius]|uniref:Uncharacterized protein n=1 Tax=Occallatibacter riparius TaxID=1002689 RepID=A0A9J7BWI3_9BACT|nr:hypothetical protein [Occallatibacter riparius]UWZ87095.1 hypothetical protein MOP44_04940 [Occallatibacter riparius]
MAIHQIHEVAFPASPVSKEADGERQASFAQDDQLSEGMGKIVDAEFVGDRSIATDAAKLGIVSRGSRDELVDRTGLQLDFGLSKRLVGLLWCFNIDRLDWRR